MFSCPNCGGNVKFDIPSQQLSCEYCHELFDPYSFENKTKDAEETPSYESDYEVTVFTCPQCGGEILSTDNAAAGFCSFCGASTILYSRISHERRPNYIIPFQKSKEDCKQAYSTMMKKAIFAPKELKDPKYIDSFRGIYMPYWAFYVTQKGPLNLSASKECRRGDYVYTDHYKLHGDMDCYYKGLSYDASSSFADSISEALAPYDLKGMKNFTPAYLSGFYADTADVAPSVYQKEAEITAYDQTIEQIQKVPQFAGYHIDSIGGNVSPTYLNTRTETVDSTMFPVWFMSYRKNDRVAYVTVNGQTGKVVADLPIDPKKYLLGSLLLAVPLFFVFALFFTLLPSKLLTLSAILALVTAILYTVELSSIAKKDSFSEDRGHLYKNAPDKLAEANRKIKSKAKQKSGGKKSMITIFVLIYIIMIAGFTILPLLAEVSINLPIVLWLVILIAMVVVFVIGFNKMDSIPGKQSILGYIAACVAIAVGGVITLLHPVSDLWYYGGTIFGLISVGLSIGDIIRYYNVLSTRRLPQFDKQGGDDRA